MKELVAFLGTDEAEDWSSNLDYLDDPKGMPRSIEETL